MRNSKKPDKTPNTAWSAMLPKSQRSKPTQGSTASMHPLAPIKKEKIRKEKNEIF